MTNARQRSRNGPGGVVLPRPVAWTAATISLLVSAFCFVIPAKADIRFENVSEASGIAFAGRTYGSSWGDFNGDGWPDLWVSGHAAPILFYLNNGNGTFTESAWGVWPGYHWADKHGASWGDFDNDGDQDLFMVTGAANGAGLVPNHFLVNYTGTFIDEAASRGLEYPLGRGRMPTWLDWDNDGLLDVFEAAEVRLDATGELFLQNDGTFTAAGLNAYTAGQSSHFAQLRSLSNNGDLKLVIHDDLNYPGRVLDVGDNSFQDRTSELGLPGTSRVIDTLIEDLDGDLDNDILLLRSQRDAPELVQTADNAVEAYLRLNRIYGDRGFTFAADSNINVEVDPSWYIRPSQIHLGASGRQPGSLNFTVSKSDVGIAPHDPGNSTGVYIGYDPGQQVWRLLASSPGSRSLEFRVVATETVSNVQSVGFDSMSFYLPEHLLRQDENGFTDATLAAGFGFPTGCESGVAGDFDNDTDVDVYLVCRSQVDNPPNLLMENLGNGVFQSVPGAGGAEGSRAGRGNTVTVADYDRDGFLDLFVTNGWGAPMLAADGPFELFRNTGNANHWIALDLVGTVSNQDAIGARVLLTADGKSQLREQGGGIHTQAQNDRLLHFGLRESDVVDEVRITWPSGDTQVVRNLVADTVHTIVEGTALPRLSIADASVDEDTGTMSFVVSLNEAAVGNIEFTASTTDGTATVVDGDYTPLADAPGTIPDGAQSTAIDVALGTDAEFEANEDFTVTLALVSGDAVLGDATATGTLVNDDASPPILSIADASVDEDTGTMSFVVSLNEAADDNIEFAASTMDGTATVADGDYTPLVDVPGTILVGELSTAMIVELGVDGYAETDEEFAISLALVAGTALLGKETAVGTILNDDGAIAVLSIGDASASEDSGFIALTIELDVAVSGDVEFTVSTADGTASVADDDYTALVAEPGVIGEGDTSATINVPFGIDAVGEPDESFLVTLTLVSGNAFIGDGTATATIINDDEPPPALSIANAAVDEDTGTISFAVSLTAPASGDIEFAATTADGTATVADGDYTPLTDAPGIIAAGDTLATVIVPLGIDSDVEADEEFSVTLALVSGNATFADAEATGTIANDDAPSGPVELPVTQWLGHQGGVTTPDNRIVYDGSVVFGWGTQVNSARMSAIGLSDDYELRLEILGNPAGTVWVAGLGVAETGPSRTDIDFGFRSSNGNLEIRENGDWRSSIGPLASGDVLSIGIAGGALEYRLNGDTIYTSTYAGAPDFYLDTAFKSGAITLAATVIGDGGDPPDPSDPPGPTDPPGNGAIANWLNAAGGVSASANTITFSGSPPAWGNTINSVALSTLGAAESYTVSFSIDSNPAGTIWVVGLGVTESGFGRTDVDYGLRSSNGVLQVRRNGDWLYTGSPLLVGDTLAIRVSGTTLQFLRNGEIVYVMAGSGGEYYIDTAFKSGAITLGSFTLTP